MPRPARRARVDAWIQDVLQVLIPEGIVETFVTYLRTVKPDIMQSDAALQVLWDAFEEQLIDSHNRHPNSAADSPSGGRMPVAQVPDHWHLDRSGNTVIWREAGMEIWRFSWQANPPRDDDDDSDVPSYDLD